MDEDRIRKLDDLIDEIDGVLNVGTSRPAEVWLRYVRIRIEKIVKAVAVDNYTAKDSSS